MKLDWKQLVTNIAPTLGAALGGPAAGMAVKFLAEQFLGEAKASEAQVAQAITLAGPDELLKLKTLDNDFAIKMRELDLDVFRIEVDDRKNARWLALKNMLPHIVLSALFILGYFGIMGGLIFLGTTQPDLKINDRIFGILNTVLGVLTAAIPMILQFWFGSSTGSKEKDQLQGGRSARGS